MSNDLSHLRALELRLSHERDRLRQARSGSAERELREIWVMQAERELQRELEHLALAPDVPSAEEIDTDTLYNALRGD